MAASSWFDELSFACPVCLETLKDPATLPCGHSYCLVCIQNHWDKGSSKGQYSCPQCRQVFTPRPSLSKSTVLVEAMDKLRANSLKQGAFMPSSSATTHSLDYLEVLPGPESRRQGSVYPQLPGLDSRACPRHNQPLDLFCQEENQFVCGICCRDEHKGHRVVKVEDERKERQEEVVRMQANVQKTIQETEKKLKDIPHAALQNKILIQSLEKESAALFSDLVKNVTVAGTEIGDHLRSHQEALGSKVEGQVNQLEQEVAQLRCRAEELGRVAAMHDNVGFFETFFLMERAHPHLSNDESVLNLEETVAASVRSVLRELQKSTEDSCRLNVEKIQMLTQDSPLSASECAEAAGGPAEDEWHQNTRHDPGASAPPLPILLNPPPGFVKPEPKTRDEMLKFRFEPTLDPHTAYRHVQLSNGGRKAAMRAENLNPPEHPERFQFWRQVLCKEPLAGIPHYWELEWTGHKITIGVAYKDIERKGSSDESRLGHNAASWSLYWSGTGFSFWHDAKEKLLGSPKANRIGVYLEQQGGFLAFYSITNNQATLIHSHRAQFTAPLYPGCRFWSKTASSLTICPLD